MGTRMNTTQLAAALGAAAGVSNTEASEMTKTLIELIGAELAAGGTVSLTGLGSFEVRDRAARNGRNPQTGESLVVPAHRAVVFRPASALRQQVNQD